MSKFLKAATALLMLTGCNGINLYEIFSDVFASFLTSQKIKVTCIGDSITSGGGCVSESYVDVLAEKLGEDYNVLNAGVSSMTMMQQGLCNDLSSCSYWDTQEWEDAIASNADIYTIMLGTNDAKYFNWEGIQQNNGDYFALDYVRMIRQLQKLNPEAKIYLMVPPPLYSPYPYSMNKTIINEIFPVLLADIAEVMEVEVVDVYSALRASDMTCDGCHPTSDGNLIIAETVAAAIIKT